MIPYFGMPYYNRYSRYGYRYPNYNTYGTNNNLNTKSNLNYNSDNFKEKKCTEHKDINKSKNDNTRNLDDSPCFQLFGINLYFDDILLICLIWFLYDEGVKDEGLFIALIMLLLS